MLLRGPYLFAVGPRPAADAPYLCLAFKCVGKFFPPLSENSGSCSRLVPAALLIIRNLLSSTLSLLQKTSALIFHALWFESQAALCPCAVCPDPCGSLQRHFHSIVWSCWSPHWPVTPVAISSNYSPSCDLLCAALRSQVIWCPLRIDSGTTLMCLSIRIISVYIICGDLTASLEIVSSLWKHRHSFCCFSWLFLWLGENLSVFQSRMLIVLLWNVLSTEESKGCYFAKLLVSI